MTPLEEFLSNIEAEKLYSILENVALTLMKKQNIISAIKRSQNKDLEEVSIQGAIKGVGYDPEDPYVKKIVEEYPDTEINEIGPQEFGEIFEQHGVKDPGREVSRMLLEEGLNAHTVVSLLSELTLIGLAKERSMFFGEKEEENIRNLKKEMIEEVRIGLTLLGSMGRSGEFRNHVFRMLKTRPMFTAALEGVGERDAEKLLARLQAAVALKELEAQHLTESLKRVFGDISPREARYWAENLVMEKDYDAAVAGLLEDVKKKKTKVPQEEGLTRPVTPSLSEEEILEEFKKSKKTFETRARDDLESAERRIRMI